MSSTKTASQRANPEEASRNLVSIRPFFIVKDLQASIAYYIKRFGFQLDFQGPHGNVFYGRVSRDGIGIFLLIDDGLGLRSQRRRRVCPCLLSRSQGIGAEEYREWAWPCANADPTFACMMNQESRHPNDPVSSGARGRESRNRPEGSDDERHWAPNPRYL